MNIEQSTTRNGRLCAIKSWINDDDEMEKIELKASNMNILAVVTEKFHIEADESGGVMCHFTRPREGQRNW